jgi:peptidoglycan L-alanyl-D-glutamate endopeptidase CwlK
VFNDPVNFVDPSGFFGDSAAGGGGLIGGLALGGLGSVGTQAIAAGGFGALGAAGVGLGGVGLTFAHGIGFGSSGSSTGPMARGTAAPTSMPATQGGMNGTGQNTGTRAPVQATQLSEFEQEMIRALENGPDLSQAAAHPRFDSLTERHLDSLRPDLQPLARQHIFTLRQAAQDARIVQGYRSSQMQADLYAQGRTRPGKIVTNARPGTSAHEFRAAYDIGLFEDGVYQGAVAEYSTLGPAAAPDGVVWGNNVPGFPKGDVGHYQLPNWQSLVQP